MIVYRFEKRGIGPYTSGSGINLYSGRSRTSNKYKTLFSEKIKSIDISARMENYSKAHMDRNYMYGCSSKDGLRMYFNGDFKTLFRQGFRIKRYRVPDSEIIDMGIEVAFPVKYHKLQKLSKIEQAKSPV